MIILSFLSSSSLYLQILYYRYGSEIKPENLKKEFTCFQCGIIFDNDDDELEHVKLEHTEHKIPSGCG